MSTFIDANKDHVLLDSGCDSGIFFNHINLYSESTYIDVDLLMSGVSNERIKKIFNSPLNRTYFVLSDISKSLPIPGQSVDIIVAHFSLYTIDTGKRRFGGLLIVWSFAMKSVLMVIQLIRQNKFTQTQLH